MAEISVPACPMPIQNTKVRDIEGPEHGAVVSPHANARADQVADEDEEIHRQGRRYGKATNHALGVFASGMRQTMSVTEA